MVLKVINGIHIIMIKGTVSFKTRPNIYIKLVLRSKQDNTVCSWQKMCFNMNTKCKIDSKSDKDFICLR